MGSAARMDGDGAVKASREALFDGYVIENGKRRRATQAEIREARRLWWKHADIRQARTKEQRAARRPSS
jgi:hypothetical protein